MTETALLYCLDETRRKKITQRLRILGVRVQHITPDMLSKRVGYLAGLKLFPGDSGETVENTYDVECLVMHGFTRQKMNQLLDGLRKVGDVRLKAIVTEKNKTWSFARLLDELEKEHVLMGSWQKLSKMVKAMPDGEEKSSAQALLDKEEVTKEELDEMIASLERKEN